MKKIVIKISDSLYDRLIDMNIESDTCSFNESALVEAIQNGTPLPRGHGRLIDADALPLNVIDDSNYGSNYIRIAQTIIEADKAGSEG